MTARSWREGRTVLAHGYGARLLGVDPARARTDPETAIRVARREVELLRPDVYVLDPAAAALPAACAAAAGIPDDPQDDAAVMALAAVAAALGHVETALALPTPTALARAVAGTEPPEDLVEDAAYAVLDVATALLDRVGGLVLVEDASHTEPEEVWGALTSLRRVSEHRSRWCLLRLDGVREAADLSPWQALASRVGWPHGLVAGTDPPPTGATPVVPIRPITSHVDRLAGPVAVEIQADADPEHVQSVLTDAAQS